MKYKISNESIVIYEQGKIICRYYMDEKYEGKNMEKKYKKNIQKAKNLIKYLNETDDKKKYYSNVTDEQKKIENIYEIDITKTITFKEYKIFINSYNSYSANKLSLFNIKGEYVKDYLYLMYCIMPTIFHIISHIFIKQTFY